MELPVVKFFGQLLTPNGPVTGSCTLTPALDVVQIKNTLVTTCAYSFDLDEDGKFEVEVFPTDIGCDFPWQYYFGTPIKAFAIALPLKGGPHNFKTMIEKGKKAK